MPEGLRVALVCLTLEHGGAERDALKLAYALKASGRQPLVVALDRDAPCPLLPLFEAQGTPVLFPPGARSDPRNLAWLVSLLRSGRIDVAHALLWLPSVMLAAAAFVARFRPVICSELGDRIADEYWTPRWRVRRAADRLLTFPVARRLVANSKAALDAAVRAGLPRSKGVVIYNSIDTAAVDITRLCGQALRERYAERGALLIGFVGRLAPEKGPMDFVRAASTIAGRVPPGSVRFVMVGDGPLRGDLEAAVAASGLREHFVLTGAVADPLPIMHAVDIGMMCSHAESFPNVLLEYMACGKPVVATRVGGIAEAVVDGRTGLLAERGAIDSLASAGLQLLADPARRKTFGEAGRRRVEELFSRPIALSKHLKLYAEVVQGARGHRVDV